MIFVQNRLLDASVFPRNKYSYARVLLIDTPIPGVATMRAIGNSARGVFDRATRLMHWLTAALMLSAFVLAFSIDLATSQAAHTVLLQLHRSALLAQPIVGLVQTNAHGDLVNLFFVGQLPALIGKDPLLAHRLLTIHRAIGFSLLSLIVLHVSAALFHHFWRRDDTLTAMLPAAAGWRRDA
jgi:cytochrome b561